MGVIIYNGISTDELGIRVETPPDYEVPSRNYEVISVPGRSGDLYIDNGRYDNVERSYTISLGVERGDFASLAPVITNWLNTGYGYRRLEDSYLPDVYMLATVVNNEPIINVLQQAGKATITFNRRPERFLKSGDIGAECFNGTILNNPTQFESKPHITFYGSGEGSVSINGYGITIKELSNGLVMDCDSEEVYLGTINKSSIMELQNGIPKLSSGVNEITYSGGVTKVVIKPRWWYI